MEAVLGFRPGSLDSRACRHCATLPHALRVAAGSKGDDKSESPSAQSAFHKP